MSRPEAPNPPSRRVLLPGAQVIEGGRPSYYTVEGESVDAAAACLKLDFRDVLAWNRRFIPGLTRRSSSEPTRGCGSRTRPRIPPFPRAATAAGSWRSPARRRGGCGRDGGRDRRVGGAKRRRRRRRTAAEDEDDGRQARSAKPRATRRGVDADAAKPPPKKKRKKKPSAGRETEDPPIVEEDVARAVGRGVTSSSRERGARARRRAPARSRLDVFSGAEAGRGRPPGRSETDDAATKGGIGGAEGSSSPS